MEIQAVVILPADVLVPIGARPLMGTVLTLKLNMSKRFECQESCAINKELI